MPDFSPILTVLDLIGCIGHFYAVDERCLLSGRVKLTNSCVVISNFMASWFNARSDCLARGGDLAVLSDQDLQIFKNSSQQLPVYSVWIGLRIMSWFWQLDSEGSFEIQ